MTVHQRLARQTGSGRGIAVMAAVTIGSRLFSRASQLIFLAVAARLLSVDEFAVYSYVLALAVTVITIGDTGAALAAGREVSAGRSSLRRAYAAGRPLVIAGSCATGLAMGAALLLSTGNVPPAAGAAAAVGYVAVNAAFNYHATLMRAAGLIRSEAWLQSLGGLAFVAIGLGALAAGAGITTVLLLLLVKELVSLGVAATVLRRSIVPGSADEPGVGWRALVRIGLVLSLASTMLVVSQRIGTIVLGNSGTSEELAQYSAAQRLLDTAFVLVGTVGYALLPAMTHLGSSDRAKAVGVARRTIAGLLVACVAATACCLAAPHLLMETIYGADFSAAGDDLRILSVGLVPTCMVAVGWYLLVGLGAQGDVLLVGAAGVASAVPAALIGVAAAGPDGAAWAFVLSGLVMALVLTWRLVVRLGDGQPQT